MNLKEYYDILNDDDKEFQWFVPWYAYMIEPRNSGFLMYTDSKFYTRHRMKKETAWVFVIKNWVKKRSGCKWSSNINFCDYFPLYNQCI